MKKRELEQKVVGGGTMVVVVGGEALQVG